MKICPALLGTAFFALATSKPLLGVFRRANTILAACQICSVFLLIRPPRSGRCSFHKSEQKSSICGVISTANGKTFSHSNGQAFRRKPPKSCWPGCRPKLMSSAPNATGRSAMSHRPTRIEQAAEGTFPYWVRLIEEKRSRSQPFDLVHGTPQILRLFYVNPQWNGSPL